MQAALLMGSGDAASMAQQQAALMAFSPGAFGALMGGGTTGAQQSR